LVFISAIKCEIVAYRVGGERHRGVAFNDGVYGRRLYPKRKI